MTQTLKQTLDGLDRAFESRIRLGIMVALVSTHHMDFKAFQQLFDTSDGNLASHLRSLEKLGYIGVRKSFVGRRPNSRYSATKIGQRAFRKHMKSLEALLAVT